MTSDDSFWCCEPQKIANALGFDEDTCEANMQYLRDRGFLDGFYDVAGGCRFAANDRSKSFFVTPDPIPRITNVHVSGTSNYVALRDINITDSKITNAISEAGIPEELKPELEALLIQLKDGTIPQAEKSSKAETFLSMVGKGFSSVVVGLASNLIVKALMGQI